MSPTSCKYRCASNQNLSVLGAITIPTSTTKGKKPKQERFVVTRLPLNLIGRESCKSLGLSLDKLLLDNVHKIFQNIKPDTALQNSCKQLCSEFPDLLKKELGTLKDFELEIRFKPDAQRVFNKPRPVLIAVQEDLDAALQAGINRGIWEPTQFNSYGTLVVPIKKKSSQGQASIRVCLPAQPTVVGSNARIMAAVGGARDNQRSQTEPAEVVASIYF
ncbi:transposon tf2-6 polyprotein [Plakobranchus ocellatus]|uniref:Transposon tf2-6 polyprotein n=1 Tax=Plakobranchus ocellatus TaxID=259542 RepID=A0AAV4BFX7_9GAST|nr:transposon tf2-6 polyprotein [Plakobranchus ocellatus]